jgi:hypothetical protein
MYEHTMSEDGEVLIEWDEPRPPPIPRVRAKPKKQKGHIWPKRLSEFKSKPGREARIFTGIESRATAKSRAAGIRDSLEGHDKYDNWRLSVFKQVDGTYGIWCCYEGRLTESQLLEREYQRREHGKRIAAGKIAAQSKRAQAIVRRDGLNRGLRPPVWTGD